MDMLAIAFYGIVCGLLGAFAPSLGTLAVRLSIGAAIGIGSAILLPLLKSTMGY